MSKTLETILEIDLNALRHNYSHITSRLKKDIKVMAVVKANGYGSDSVVVAKELVKLGVDYFAVAYSSEGEVLRNAEIHTPILVLHPLPVNFQIILDRCLEPSIYSKKMLREFIEFARSNGQSDYPIHLKFNTGLNRLGFLKKDIPFILELLAQTKSVKVKSVFSHLAASEDKDEIFFTQNQINSFKAITSKLTDSIEYLPILHAVNTSGILNFPEAQLDMVRTGIGLYGFGNDPEENKNLVPIAALKTVISQLHKIKAGDSVGYNKGFTARKDMMIATLPIGHADGISRAYGKGKGWVTIHNNKAPIVGNVCMDMVMVDVTDIQCEEGDEVIVFDKNSTAEVLSAAIDSIPYELLTAISHRIKRVIVSD